MLRYMLDTDMCSYIIKEHPLHVLLHFQKLEMENICISIVSYAELMYGVERSNS
ncbi:MAG: type II toxin-antitoxin system VapC family toxin [Methylococcales bacterium]|nr:type II toxin-antitoxin system VapC family toxin [Methylococcales bacterium]